MDHGRVSTCLWFDSNAEEAARFYTTLLDDSRITAISHQAEGRALMVAFELGGVPFQALNGGPHYKLSPACSISVSCETQTEIERLWLALLAGGGVESQCGWLEDRFGLSWQIVPRALGTMMTDPDPARVARVVAAFMPMKKLDLAVLEAAYRSS